MFWVVFLCFYLSTKEWKIRVSYLPFCHHPPAFRFSGKSRNSGLVPGNRDPKFGYVYSRRLTRSGVSLNQQEASITWCDPVSAMKMPEMITSHAILEPLKQACDSPRLAEESKSSPARKVKKESPKESPGESSRVLASPPKRVKNESPGDSVSQKSPVFWLRRLIFDSFWGSARTLGDSPGDSPGDSFLTFRAREEFVKNEKSAQRVSFWDGHPADIRGSFARISRPKTSVRALKILEKQAFGRGHPWPEGADVHDPKGLPKTSVRKTLGWIFVP